MPSKDLLDRLLVFFADAQELACWHLLGSILEILGIFYIGIDPSLVSHHLRADGIYQPTCFGENFPGALVLERRSCQWFPGVTVGVFLL